MFPLAMIVPALLTRSVPSGVVVPTACKVTFDTPASRVRFCCPTVSAFTAPPNVITASVVAFVSTTTFAPKVTAPVKLAAPAVASPSVLMSPFKRIAVAVADTPLSSVFTSGKISEEAELTVSPSTTSVPPTAPLSWTAPLVVVPAAIVNIRAVPSESTVPLIVTLPSAFAGVIASTSIVTSAASVTGPVIVTLAASSPLSVAMLPAKVTPLMAVKVTAPSLVSMAPTETFLPVAAKPVRSVVPPMALATETSPSPARTVRL